MKDEEIKLEEIEASHTLGGVGRCYAAVIHTKIHQSDGRSHNRSCWVMITCAPVCVREFLSRTDFCLFVYYQSIKRKLNRRLILECRCDERLKTKDEGTKN